MTDVQRAPTAEVLPLPAPCRADPDVAEEVYLGDEKTPAVLRAELDATRDYMHRMEADLNRRLGELGGDVAAKHDSYNSRHHQLGERLTRAEKQLVILLGDGSDVSDGVVRELQRKVSRLFDGQERSREDVWKLRLLYVASVGGVGTSVLQALGVF